MDSTTIFDYPYLGLSPLKSDQDFCIGAKPAITPSPVGYTQYSDGLTFDDQFDQYGYDFNSLDAFNGVLLQEDNSLNVLATDILSDDCQLNAEPQFNNYSNMEIDLSPQSTFSSTWYENEALKSDLDQYLNPIENAPISPNVDAKSEIYQQLEQYTPDLTDAFQAFDYEPLQAASSKITIKLKKFKSNKVSKKRLGNLKTKEILPIDYQQVPDARLTLKDAINLDNSDVILDRLFEPDSEIEIDEYTPSSSSAPSPSHSMPSPSHSMPSELSLSEFFEVEIQSKRRGRAKGSPSERYVRKKEQNKQAAIRYRSKKRRAEDDLQNIMLNEEEKQKKLKKELKRLKQQVKFMKTIMREAFIVKGLVSAADFKTS